MSVPQAIAALASFCAQARWEAMPQAVREHAPWVLLDVIGAALAGSAAAPASRLASACIAESHGGDATVLRAGLPRSDKRMAAWLNGISAVWLELDPGHRHCRTHAPAHVMPAALAEAQSRHASGQDLLAAFTLGCEVAYRMGGAIAPRPEVNAHGTWALPGAAAACARLRRLDEQGTANALRIASQLPLATAFRSSLAGVTTRHVYVGAAAQSALQAADLAEAGFDALEDAPAITFGQVLGTSFDAASLTRGLGDEWEFMRDFAKLHACCHHLYPAVDALQALLEADRPTPDAIERIIVHTYGVAARLADKQPATELAAKFSIPYGLAAFMLRGSLDAAVFRAPHLLDPVLLALAARIDVRKDAALDACFPRERAARVELLLRDGSTRGVECRSTKGDYLDPLTPEARRAKFDSLCGSVLAPAAVPILRERILNIEILPAASMLLDPSTL